MRTAIEVDKIIADVQRRLDIKSKELDYMLRVPSKGYVNVDDWLSIIVSPDRPGMRASVYVEALGDVEDGMRADGITHVALVPAVE